MFLEDVTSTTMRILVQISRNKEESVDSLAENLEAGKEDIETAIESLVKKKIIRKTRRDKYKLLINPATTTLYDVALIADDRNLAHYLYDKKYDLNDSLDRFYSVSRTINLNWIKTVTVKELASGRQKGLKQRGRI